MTELLLNPDFAYLMLVLGFFLTILAVVTPGTGLLEIGALFSLVLAGYSVYNLPINVWALVLLLAGVIPFMLALRKSGRLIFLGISILALVLGSIFLFRSEVWWQPAVNPILALVVSVLAGGFLWMATVKVLDAERSRPVHDLGALIGATGEAKTAIHEEGSVQVAGELWTAYSQTPIPAGTRVRVIGREGFLLQVEALPVEQPQPAASTP